MITDYVTLTERRDISMKKILLPLLLACVLLLSACSLPWQNAEPSAAPTEEPGTAQIEMFRADSAASTNEPEPEPENEPEPTETPEEPEPEATEAPALPEEPAAPLDVEENTAVLDLELVRVMSYMPDLKVDLKYATTDNYTGKVVYSFDEPYLRYGTVKKLFTAQSLLKAQGYELVVWDAFRPPEAQYVLFDAHPDGAYVANPYGGGHSSHSSGGTVDVALMKDGALVELPSGFDEFSPLGDKDYSDVTAEAAANANLLDKVMTQSGFTGYFGEWWHYTDTTGYNYTDVEEAVLPEHGTRVYESVCNEYINIRRVANPTAEAIGNVPNGEHMTVLSYLSGFAHIQYGEVTGYVNSYFIKPIY